jgi:hypothetical protein
LEGWPMLTSVFSVWVIFIISFLKCILEYLVVWNLFLIYFYVFLFIELSWSHDSDHEFCKIIKVNSSHFFC